MTDLTEDLNDLKELVSTAEIDAAKFYNGNRTAGIRVRKTMQNIKGIAQKIRATVLVESKR